jgi:acid phosphatase (class A)
MRKSIMRTLLIGVSFIIGSCASTPSAGPPAPKSATVGTMTGNVEQGYLATNAVPSSVALLPPPPASGSAAMARDEEINRSALTMRGTPRWDMAIHDAVLTFPAVAQTFSCALNVPISNEQTPKLIALMQKTLFDAGRATGEAKQRYLRPRPFISNGQPTCTPDREAGMRNDGSYPSGHGSIGWAFGLVLAEVAPERANEVLSRARDFTQSRLVCNAHWQSDIQEGQFVGAAVVARLHAEPTFRNDVAAAHAEIEALRAKGASVQRDCKAEAQALATWK